MEEIRKPDGSRWRFYRDRFSRVMAHEDGKGQRTQVAYDELDRVLSVTDPLGNRTVYGYNANSNLVSLTNAAAAKYGSYGSGIYGTNVYASPSQEMQFFYNSRNLLSQLRYQDGSAELFGYDPAGNLTSYQDNQARTRTSLYDNLERLTQVTYVRMSIT